MPVSTVEWIASESMAELPEMLATKNLVAAMRPFAASAPYKAIGLSCFFLGIALPRCKLRARGSSTGNRMARAVFDDA